MNNAMQMADLSATYGAGSFLATVRFDMDGQTFIAKHFRRTDMKIDSLELYIAATDGKTALSWADDFVKMIDPTSDNLSRVDRRALHMLAVAITAIPADVAVRFSLIELN